MKTKANVNKTLSCLKASEVSVPFYLLFHRLVPETPSPILRNYVIFEWSFGQCQTYFLDNPFTSWLMVGRQFQDAEQVLKSSIILQKKPFAW